MKNLEGTNSSKAVYFRVLAAALICVCCGVSSFAAAAGDNGQTAKTSHSAPGNVIVIPKFGGQILGYAVDPGGTEGVLSEFVNEPNGNILSATETFDQSTGQILDVVAQAETPNDFATQGVFGNIGLILYQRQGQNHFLKMNPLAGHKFNGAWTPPIMPGYQLWTTSFDQGTPNVAAYQLSFNAGLTYVFGSNIAENTFGPQISLASIIDVDEFFQPQIALDSKTNQAVLADSHDCPEPVCVTSIALVNLTTGEIDEFTDNLGVGEVNGLAVDSAKGIACTTTSVGGGVEFYDLAKETGFGVTIPGGGSAEDVEFDPIHRVFLVASSESIYVYDEQGNIKETISGLQRTAAARIALNPVKRIGFVPVIVEPINEFLELQSFSY